MTRKKTKKQTRLSSEARAKKKMAKIKKFHSRIDYKHYVNREISWLKFNQRVLNEAKDQRVPLLERLKFCNIVTSNLDEFFMKRVGGLKNLIKSKYPFLSIDGKSPQEQIFLIRELVNEQTAFLSEIFDDRIKKSLEEEKIFLKKWSELHEKDKLYLKEYFQQNIFPVITPLAVDYGHPFPFISNLSKSIGICLKKSKQSENLFARVKVPREIEQWIKIPTDKNEDHWISLDEVITNNLDLLFPGMKITGVMLFRVTRNVDIEDDDESAEDLLELVEDSLHEKRFSPVIRLEHEKNPNPWILKYLMDQLELSKEDLYEMPSIACHSSFSTLIDMDRPKLKYPAWTPKTPVEIVEEGPSFFNILKRKDMLVQHPYESFNATVEKFIYNAAHDSNVLAIKITLYRTNINGDLINALVYAAEHGKQVACLIELKARFEEEKNIYLAEKLENAGVHVIMGMVGLKTHSKMCLVVRRDSTGIHSYVHIGTGNYNSSTAQTYEDYSYFTSKKSIANEVMEVFNYLTGISLKQDYKKILVAPLTMRARFVALIKNETKLAKEGKKTRIVAKMNSLEDIEIIECLYEASQSGVQVELIVRGFCCLRPQVKGLSDNIRVYSLIGRFLEHSRVYFFSRGESSPDKGEFYLGSADWMYRNLNNRVEVITPITEKVLKNKIWFMFEAILNDHRSVWELDDQGHYTQRSPRSEIENDGTHQVLMNRQID